MLLRKKRLCARCGSETRPKRHIGGSFLIELFVWGLGVVGLLFFPFGMIILCCAFLYSLWRLSATKFVCRACGSAELLPLNSPAALRLADEFRKKPAARQEMIDTDAIAALRVEQDGITRLDVGSRNGEADIARVEAREIDELLRSTSN